MQRLDERLGRTPALRSVMLWLYLALPATSAQAAVRGMQQVRPAAMSQTAAAPHSVPAARDCLPCARCYVAPLPTPLGFSGECREPEETVWHMPGEPALTSAWLFDTRGGGPRLPVRIAFCRWLD